MVSRRKVQREARYRLRGFEILGPTLELRDQEGARVGLPPLAFDLLLYLVEHRDRVVSKEELFDALWSDVVTTDNSLSQAIWAVRRALGDTGGAQRVIQSVRGRGYRFVADAEPIGAEASATPLAPSSVVGPRVSPVLPLLGRDAELSRLHGALEQVLAGQGAIVHLFGGPGAGKTRMATEACEAARRRGALAYEGRCLDTETMPPFWPLQQAMRALVRDQPPERLPELLGDAASDLVKLIPELREALPNLSVTPERLLEQERFQLFDALRALLERACAQAPLVVVLDDLHWADEATLLFLEFLAPNVARMPLLLVVAGRPSPARPAVQRCLLALRRQDNALELDLPGLDQDQVRALLAAHGVSELEPGLARRVHALTAGNPFLVIQMARWLAALPPATRNDPAVPLALPPQALSLLEQQIGALEAPSRELLVLAAVLGDPFHLGDLRRASALSPAAVLDALEPALRAQLVREVHAGEYAFCHPTIRAAAYDALPRSRRVQLHRRAAEAIAEASFDDPTARLGELAHHYYEAAPDDCAEQAVRFCMLAAERAAEATAYEESVALYRRARAALELIDRPDERRRCLILLGLGRSLRGTAEPIQNIRDTFAEAAARARAIGDARLSAEAAMCFAGRGPRRVGALREAGTVVAAEIDLLEQVLSAIGDDDCTERALLLAWLANALYHGDRSAERRELAQQAVDVARRVGDRAALAECLMLSQAAVRGPGELDARCAVLGEVIEHARAIGLRGLQLDAHDERAWARLEAGDLGGSRSDVQSLQRLAEELRQPREKRALAAFRMLELDGDGRFDEGRAVFDAAQASAPWRRSGDRLDQGAAIRDFMVGFFRGRSGEMLVGLEAYAEKFPLPMAWDCGLAATYAAAGRSAEAQAKLDRFGADGFACIPDDHNWLASHGLLALTARVLGDARHAAVLYDKLEPHAERVIVVGLHGFCAGPMQRPLAELCLATGELDRGEAHILAAKQRALQLGTPLWTAWCQLLHAELRMRRGRRGDEARAREELDEALAYSRERGLGLMIEWGERLAQRRAAPMLHRVPG